MRDKPLPALEHLEPSGPSAAHVLAVQGDLDDLRQTINAIADVVTALADVVWDLVDSDGS